LAGHPGFGAENALEEGGEVEVGVQSGPVEAEAGGGDFDFGEVFGGGTGEAFGELRREGKLDAGVERDDDAGGAAVVAGGCGVARIAAFRHQLLGGFEFLLSNFHEWRSI